MAKSGIEPRIRKTFNFRALPCLEGVRAALGRNLPKRVSQYSARLILKFGSAGHFTVASNCVVKKPI